MENANRSRGLCVRGCPPPRPSLARSALSTSLSKDQTVSTMAGQICDVYLQNFTGPQSLVPSRLASFVQQTRRACVTDVTVMGEKKVSERFFEHTRPTLLLLVVSVCRRSGGERRLDSDVVECDFAGANRSPYEARVDHDRAYQSSGRSDLGQTHRWNQGMKMRSARLFSPLRILTILSVVKFS